MLSMSWIATPQRMLLKRFVCFLLIDSVNTFDVALRCGNSSVQNSISRKSVYGMPCRILILMQSERWIQ